ncbi:MAG: putative Universal stress protein [Nitrosopumilales archaeon]|nr:MAG: putative Universal stress protein [Nitrosopumilales archaeon]
MFKKILVTFVTSTHSGHTSDVAFELAKKFNSKITFLKCIMQPHPIFGFFHTKGEKESHKKELQEAEKSLHEIEDLAKKFDVSIKTLVESVESFPDFLVSYIEKNHTDLLIIDSHSLDEAAHQDHKATINKIFEEISCPFLTLK